MPQIKVMVDDDSALVRRVVSRMLADNPDIELAGTAANGLEALEKVPEVKPDVIVLDVEMPVMDGLETLRRLMQTRPVPVVMLSALTRAGSRATLEALALGAVDFIPKPANPAELSLVKSELAAKIKTAAAVSLRNVIRRGGRPEQVLPVAGFKSSSEVHGRERRELVVIGCSTGGPAALQEIIPSLPADLPACIVVVQHMPVGFTGVLAEHLGKLSSLIVRHANGGEPVSPGQVLIAPSGFDLYFSGRAGKAKVKLVAGNNPPVPGAFRPSVDKVMVSAAEFFGPKVLGVLLTGMGRDGALGMQEIKRNKGLTIAEAEESCVVFGMPKAAIELGAVDKVVPLKEIAREIVNKLQ
ncbi:MAG: chemotaxis response regulator protein-glutamate methylesterase [Bacillota bacterium]